MKIGLLVVSLELVDRLELACAKQTRQCTGIGKLKFSFSLRRLDFDRLCGCWRGSGSGYNSGYWSLRLQSSEHIFTRAVCRNSRTEAQ